jgi:hypothetical protein
MTGKKCYSEKHRNSFTLKSVPPHLLGIPFRWEITQGRLESWNFYSVNWEFVLLGDGQVFPSGLAVVGVVGQHVCDQTG